MSSLSRLVWLSLSVFPALGLSVWAELCFANSVHQRLDAAAVGPAAGTAPAPSAQSSDPNDFVQVRDGKFVLAGKPFVIKGTNYTGSWRTGSAFVSGDQKSEQLSIWSFYHDWNAPNISRDLQLLHAQLKATVVRIPLPARQEFEANIKYHGYASWYEPKGTIAPEYAKKLLELADLAAKNNIRLELCLLWNIGNEIEQDPDGFRPGAVQDLFYANYVRSVARLLGNHPAVIAYSIGNEVLVRWKINGTHTSWFEPRAVGFMLRRISDLRATAPHQLISTEEIVGSPGTNWSAPSADLALIPDADASNGGFPIRLVESVDYLGVHFYPEILTPQDVAGAFEDKVTDAVDRLRSYLAAARTDGKPVVLNEFALKVKPETMRPQDYGPARDRLFERVLAEGEADGLQGMLAWYALPRMVLRPGQYEVRDSRLNPYSPIEVDLQGTVAGRRVIMYKPYFELFVWNATGDDPVPTAAARALAAAWAKVPVPPSPARTGG